MWLKDLVDLLGWPLFIVIAAVYLAAIVVVLLVAGASVCACVMAIIGRVRRKDWFAYLR